MLVPRVLITEISLVCGFWLLTADKGISQGGNISDVTRLALLTGPSFQLQTELINKTLLVDIQGELHMTIDIEPWLRLE